MDEEQIPSGSKVTWPQRLTWGFLSGVLSVVVFVMLLGVYDHFASPRGGGGGLGGAFFAMGLVWIFFVGVAPVFAAGAAAGAVARGKSARIARYVITAIPVVGLLVGAPLITWVFGVHEQLIYIHGGPNQELHVTALENGVVITGFEWAPEEEGQNVSPTCAVQLQRPQAGAFDLTLTCDPPNWKGMRIEFESQDFAGVQTTLNGEPVSLPLEVSRRADPHTVVIRGQFR